VSATRILVVDDEPQVHRFLKPALEAAGYSVERADSAAEALRLAVTHNPAMILLDLGLPDMDGQDVLTRLRACLRRGLAQDGLVDGAWRWKAIEIGYRMAEGETIPGPTIELEVSMSNLGYNA